MKPPSAAFPLLGSQFTVQCSHGVFESGDPIACAGLLPAMFAGRKLEIGGGISARLLEHLPEIQTILSCFLRGRVSVVPVEGEPCVRQCLSGKTSLFFSGGVDSLYSLLVNRDEIQSLILVHGFDVPLDRVDQFAACQQSAQRVARRFNKELVVVRTDLRSLPGDTDWKFWHGGALAAVAHALAHLHRTVLVASAHKWENLHPWGSHPQLDPLWSTEAVSLVHHGAETRRVDKTAMICREEAVQELRVCWESLTEFNCGRCEKCVRTMVALAAFGALGKARFSRDLKPAAIRAISLGPNTAPLWQELLGLDLAPRHRAAVEQALANFRWNLPPRDGSARGELRRCYHLVRRILEMAKSVVS